MGGGIILLHKQYTGFRPVFLDNNNKEYEKILHDFILYIRIITSNLFQVLLNL